MDVSSSSKTTSRTSSTYTLGATHTLIAFARPISDAQTATWRTLWRTSPNDHPLLIQDATNLIGYYDNDTASFISYGVNLGTIQKENVWTMFTVVGTSGPVRSTLYIDDLKHTGFVNFNAAGMNHDAFGSTAGPTGSQPFGYLSVGLIYSRALSATEILQNWYALSTRHGLV